VPFIRPLTSAKCRLTPLGSISIILSNYPLVGHIHSHQYRPLTSVIVSPPLAPSPPGPLPKPNRARLRTPKRLKTSPSN
jgi:hypothetical protein